MISQDNQIEFWNSASYEKTFTHPINIEKLKPFITPTSSILDFGCGYGRICNILFELGYKNIIGVDSAHKMIDRGGKEFPHIKLVCFQGNELPFESNRFDLIILLAVLTCIPTDENQQSLINELLRILKPEGILYVSDYWLQSNESNINRYKKFEEKYGQYGVFELPEGAIFRHHTKEWIKSLFSKLRTIDLVDCELLSMNGNKSSCFQFIGSKPVKS